MRIPIILTLLLGGLGSALFARQSDPGPPPGRLVDVGGRRLHLLCSGTGGGSPTIVLEAGASSFAIDWTLVQQELARTNRVCSYDRAGSGWSDPPAPGSSVPVSLDLHNLLRAAGEPAPYILVGASLGGIYVRLYQADYPDEVVGLVLVDPTSEDRLFTMFNGQAVEIASLTAEQLRTLLPAAPVAVPKRRPQQGAPFDRLPEALYQVRLKLDQRLIASVPDTVTPDAIGRFRETERANLARLRELRLKTELPLAGLPLVVLTRGTDQGEGLIQSHRRLAALSSNSRQVVATGAGHEIHLFAPELVVRAIRAVGQAVRTGGETQLAMTKDVGLDHLILGVPSLSRGIDSFAKLTGVVPVRGGQHPGRGTENALVSLGAGQYLELLAPVVPDASRPNLRLVGWALHTRAIDEVIGRVRPAGYSMAGPTPGSRRKPDSTLLEWRTAATSGPGLELAPFIIEWGQNTAHPSTTTPGGCRLIALHLTAPDGARLGGFLKAVGYDAEVHPGSAPALRLTLECPRGRIDFVSPGREERRP